MIDNDAFILLAGSRLLKSAIEYLGFTTATSARLHALPFMLGRSRSIQLSYPPDAIVLARLACEEIPAVPEREDNPDIIDRLISIDGIDDGEALLLALTLEDPNCYLMTGDKRFVEALVGASALADLRANLTGRLICFERVCRELVERLGSAAITEALITLRPYHAGIKIYFSEGNRESQENCLLAINAYYDDLARRGSDLLY